MEAAFVRRLPMRGCIGIADVLVDDALGLILSSVFPDLLKSEKNQDWSGCFIAQDAAENVIKAILGTVPDSLKVSMPILPYPVPLKNSRTPENERWCLDWVHMLDEPDIPGALQYLTSPKKEATQAFFAFIKGLEDDSLDLADECYPAVKLKIFKARSGMRTKYCDATGRGVEPGSRITFEIRHEDGTLGVRFTA